MKRFACFGVVLAIIITVTTARSQTSVSNPAATSDVIVRNVAVDGAVVTGIIENRSERTVRDVRLLIRHTWLWNDERNPGEDNPGRAAYQIVSEEIPAGGISTFTYRAVPPLPSRTDGRFETSVQVVGFVEVGE